MTPEPGKFYLATRAAGDTMPIGCADGNDTPFIVKLHGGLPYVWGFSIWKNSPGYRTYGIPLRDFIDRHPGLTITEDRDRRLDPRPRRKPPAFDTATADPLEPMSMDAQRVNVWSWARALERVVDGKSLGAFERADLAVLLGQFKDMLGERE